MTDYQCRTCGVVIPYFYCSYTKVSEHERHLDKVKAIEKSKESKNKGGKQ